MAVRPHHNGLANHWIIDYYPEGRKGKRERIPFEGSYEAALAAEREYRQMHHSAAGSNPKILDVIHDYLLWYKLHRKEATYNDLSWCLEKQLIPFFGNLPINRITPQLIDRYHAHRGKPCSSNKELSYLGGLITWMVKRHYARPLPFKIERVEYIRPLPKVPGPEAFDDFMQAVRSGYKNSAAPKEAREIKEAALFIMYHAGLRYKEIKQAKWGDLSLEEGTIYLGNTKNGRPRFAILPHEAITILTNYKKDKNASEHVFLNPRTGEPYGSMKSLFRGASARAGIKIKGPHTLRHAHATNMLDATNDIRTAQVSLGHADIKSTQWYTQVALERQKELSRKTRDYVDSKPRKKQNNNK